MQNETNNETDYNPPGAGQEDGLGVRNYMLMILEQKWYALAAFLAVVIGAILYTFLSTPLYQSYALVQVLKHSPQIMRVEDVVESSVTTDTDFNTQIKILESLSMIQGVVSRLTTEETTALLDPFRKRGKEPPTPIRVIQIGRKISPLRLSLMIQIQFRHPNAKIAARISNLFTEEYIAYNSRVRVEESLKAVDELKLRADQQRKRVDELANALQAFRQRGNLISLVQSKDIVTERLKALNLMATQTNANLKNAEVRLNQVQEWIREKRDVAELPFVASLPKVGQLLQQISSQRIVIAQLRDRYKDQHPRLIEAANTLRQAETELQAALKTTAASIKAEYENAVQTNAEASKALAEQESKSLELDKSSVEYENLTREFRVNEQLLESMLTRMRETAVSSTIEAESARIVDRAVEASAPVSPSVLLNIAIGVLAGILAGVGLAYIITLIDDRVKKPFDVEAIVGLPLLGVIPKVSRLDQPEKAQIVSNGADKMIVEAFLSLYSTLRVSEESRNAKLVLVTSTLPGEGKSFITTNLALTFASQGQRTIIVDCDLRKPNVHRSFRLSLEKGLVDYCSRELALPDAIVKNVYPNLDVMVAGGRAKNPTRIFNSAEFETLIEELSKKYDRVIFDTPPIGAVSDVLNILPLMDGAIYAIHHNHVRRRAARSAVRRLAAANIPIFGAVLNGMDLNMTNDYHGEYHNKSYKEYYEAVADHEPSGVGAK